MPNTVTKTIINQGPSKLVLHVLVEGDGEAELANYVLLDPTVDVAPTQGLWTQMSILQVWYSTAWFDCVLGFNALNPTKSWVLTRDAGNYHDFRYFGGLKDRSEVEHDGKVLLTTSGLAVPGTTPMGTLVIELKKNYASPNPTDPTIYTLP